MTSTVKSLLLPTRQRPMLHQTKSESCTIHHTPIPPCPSQMDATSLPASHIAYLWNQDSRGHGCDRTEVLSVLLTGKGAGTGRTWGSMLGKWSSVCRAAIKVWKKLESVETESSLVVSRGWGERVMQNYCLTGTEFQFRMMTKFWNWVVMLVPQQCECA